jgi:hypothetical protein
VLTSIQALSPADCADLMAASVALVGPCARAAALAASHNTNSFDFKKPPLGQKGSIASLPVSF